MTLVNSRHIENQILTTLLKSEFPDEISNLAGARVDWNYILIKAEEHRIVPLLFQKIKTNFAETVPSQIFDEFQKREREIAKLNFGRTTQLIKLVKILKENEIPVIAYKGMSLAAAAYGNIGLRQFTDIDLLIHRRDFWQVKSIFKENNCPPAWKLTENQEKAALKNYYEYPFFYGEDKTLVEVHWNFTEPFFAFDINIEAVFERVQPITLCGRRVPTLAAEDSLIVLAAHGSKHFWKRLSWIYDIAKLIENTAIDWETAVRRAKRVGCGRMLNLALHLAADLLNAELPAEIKRQIAADRQINGLAEMFKRNLFAEKSEFSGWREMAKIHLKMRERNLDKLRYSQRLLKTKLMDSLFLPMGRPQ